MLCVLNKCYGGWSLSDWAVEQLGIEDRYACLDDAQLDNLIQLIDEAGSKKCSGSSAKLKVVEIPDNCTDYEISDYDGVETITYVVDGKLYHA